MTTRTRSVHAVGIIGRLDGADLPCDPWWRSHAVVKAILDGGCNNSAAHHLQRYAAGADRSSVGREVAYQLGRSHQIRLDPALASLPAYVGDAAVADVADAMIDAMNT